MGALLHPGGGSPTSAMGGGGHMSLLWDGVPPPHTLCTWVTNRLKTLPSHTLCVRALVIWWEKSDSSVGGICVYTILNPQNI